MKCPVDDRELVMSERRGIEIDYCPTCRGVWLDRGELDKLVEQIAHGVLHDPGQRHYRLVSDGRGFRGIVVCGVFHCTIVP